jgi:hypothetical protein
MLGGLFSVLLAGLLLGGGAAPLRAADAGGGSGSAPGANPVPPPKPFGASLVQRRCLVFTAKSLRDRQADLEHQDWVVLALENRCPVPVLNLQVELLLIDTRGSAYGKVFWVLGQGEQLNAGGRWEDTVAIPDPDNRVAQAWTLRVLRADTYAPGRPMPQPPRDSR